MLLVITLNQYNITLIMTFTLLIYRGINKY